MSYNMTIMHNVVTPKIYGPVGNRLSIAMVI